MSATATQVIIRLWSSSVVGILDIRFCVPFRSGSFSNRFIGLPAIELISSELTVERERRVPIVYEGQRVRDDLRAGEAGLLFNFNALSIRAEFERLDHRRRSTAGRFGSG